MADWDPDLYRVFEDERTRPAKDLLAQVRLEAPTEVVDLGCGPGNSTSLLASRFPGARLSGIDSSEAMLRSARERLPHVGFGKADIETWAAERPLDLLYCNAVLQWLPDHPALLPRLLGMLKAGGVLAIQMPDNADEPSHRLMREVAAQGPWRRSIEAAGAALAKRVLTAAAYHDLLAPLAARTDIWRTAYHHPMPSPRSIVDWLRSTGLKPFLEAIDDTEREAFLARYEAALDAAYPARADGRRLLVFPRLFLVARKA